jgi:hypothetical protein
MTEAADWIRSRSQLAAEGHEYTFAIVRGRGGGGRWPRRAAGDPRLQPPWSGSVLVVLVQRLGQLWLSNRATNMALSWARALETDTATRLHLPFSSRWMAIPSLALRLSALEK